MGGSPTKDAMSWHPRASQIGYYQRCLHRMSLDRRLALGELTLAQLGLPVSVRESSVPADFGTFFHWYMQCALRCDFKNTTNDFVFRGWNKAEADTHQPSTQAILNGAKLIGSEQQAYAMAGRMCQLAIPRMPRKDTNWMAEAYGVMPGLLGGHIDLLSEDLDDIVDIKTTGTCPVNGKMKPAHMWQVAAYALLVYAATGHLPKRGHILYIHNRGEWVCRSNPLEFDTPFGNGLLDHLAARLEFYGKEEQNRGACAPSPGDACDEDFCPYTSICRDKLIPKGAHVYRPEEAPLLSVDPFSGTTP